MKKKLLVIVSVLLLVLLAACGNSENKPKEKEKSDVKVDKNVGEKQEASEGDPDSKPAVEGPGEYMAKQEILDAEWHSGLLQVNDKVIQLPTSLSELVAMGFDYVVDDGDKKKDYLFADGESIYYNLLLDGKEVCTLYCTYEGSKLVTLEEINPKVESIYFSGMRETELSFFLPGGVTLNDTMQAVEEKLGEPLQMEANKYDFVYTYGRPDEGSDLCKIGVSVNVNRENQLVSSFEISRNVVPSKYEDFSADQIVSVKNLQSQDVHDVRVLFPDLYLDSDAGLRRAETVFKKESDFYSLNLCFLGALQKYFNQYELQTAGTLLYEATDENGVARYVYDTGVIYCFKAPFVMKISVQMIPISFTDADIKALYQEYLVELGKTVQY